MLPGVWMENEMGDSVLFRWLVTGFAVAGSLGVCDGAHALTTVRFALADPGVALGATTNLEIRADFDSPVLGFGIDLLLDPAVLTAIGSPVVGPAWTPVFAPDGDGLAGLAPITGVAGPDVPLATLTVLRTSLAGTLIDGALTPGDLTEGFPLPTAGFDSVVFVSTPVVAIPEPTTVLLLAGGLGVLSWRRRKRTERGRGFARIPFGIGVLSMAAAVALVAPARALALVLSCEPLQANFEVLQQAAFNTRAHNVSRDGRIVSGFTENGAAGRPLLWDENGSLQFLPFSGSDMHAFEISDPDPATGVRIITGMGGTAGAGGARTYVRWIDGVLEDTGVASLGPGVSFLSTQWDSAIGATPDGHTFVGSDPTLATGGGPFLVDVPTEVNQPLPAPLDLGTGGGSAISDDGFVVAGYVRNGLDFLPAIWVGGGFQLLPLSTVCPGTRNFGRALDVSADGTVVVGRVRGCKGGSQQIDNAAVWRNGQLFVLPMDLPSASGASAASAISVSPDGRYVVGTQNRTVGPAFIWSAQDGLRDLAEVLARDYGLTAEMATWSLIAATDVTVLPNGSIVIVGYMWPTSRPQGPGNFSGFRVTLEAGCPDDDLDGLCNEWEEQQYVDVNCDGVKETPGTDLELPGADPEHKNIYVEIDRIQGSTIPGGAIVDVEQAFARVPNELIGNPDGMPGITLFLDEDDPDLPAPIDPSFPFERRWVSGTGCGMPLQFEGLKNAYFGTTLERGSPELLAVKRRLFRYMIVGSTFAGSTGGQALPYGPDALVGDALLADRDEAAGSMMHELGHTLGLDHGGYLDGTNYKPNYHSVMNYTWGIPAFVDTNSRLGTNAYRASWVLDFSRVAFGVDLDEVKGVDETLGLAGAPGHERHVVPISPKKSFGTLPVAFPRLEFESGPIDFDQDTIPLEPVSDPVNLNAVNPADSRPSEVIDRLEVLAPRADWPFVAQNLAASYGHPNWTMSPPTSCAGMLLGPEGLVEPTIAELRGLSVDLPIDCNGNGVEDTDELNGGTATDDNDNFLLDECEPVAGDCDADDDVDEEDRAIFIRSFGRSEGETDYRACADLDGDRSVTLVDYQAWIAAYEAARAAPTGCGGAGGGEAAMLLGVWAWHRRHGQRRAPR